jgi:small subunit ribosomal protein S1
MAEKDRMKKEEAPEPSVSASKPSKPNDGEMSFSELYEKSLKKLEEGEIVNGTIVAITGDEILVDVGYKSEGTISLREFPDPKSLKVGDQIEVLLEKKEDQDGVIVLSKEKADFYKTWDQIYDLFERSETVQGKVIELVKGGLSVDIGVRAFLPASQVGLRPIKELNSLIGQTLPMKIIKLNKRRRNIVLSRKAVLVEEREKLRSELIKTIDVGQVVEGEVKNITDFGAFVDIGGMDGLLHITDITWGRIKHPSEVLAIGDKIKVVVLDFDKENERVSLGMKQLAKHPWADIEERYKIGQHVKGKIRNITDYGAFVELEPGIEGLIHISEMSWTRRVKHPSKLMAVGDTVEAVILSIDPKAERISLGLRQTEPDPWQTMSELYPIGTIIEGKVRNITDFGAFVEVEEGIDGLVHISDISWTRRIKHPSEVLRKGQRVQVMVLNIDVPNRRISLGMKQLTEDPWSKVEDIFKLGEDLEGEVVKITSFGLIIKLKDDIEGLLHISEICDKHIDNLEKFFRVGDLLNLRVININREERKINLSLREYLHSHNEPADSDTLTALREANDKRMAEAGIVPPEPVIEDDYFSTPEDPFASTPEPPAEEEKSEEEAVSPVEEEKSEEKPAKPVKKKKKEEEPVPAAEEVKGEEPATETEEEPAVKEE